MRLIKFIAVSIVNCAMLVSCSSKKDKAIEDAKEAQKIINSTAQEPEKTEKNTNAITPESRIRTSVGGYTLNARIDGKLWAAKYMYSPETTSMIVGENDVDGYSISLPFDKRDMVVNKKITLSHTNAVDFFVPGDHGGNMAGFEGEIEITSVDADWAEGRFEFTATAYGVPSVKVTDGYFRVNLK
jgi:hypothetical protein